jgi:5'(3')-deoxyribonucleotidase
MRGKTTAIDFFFHKNAEKVFYLSEPYEGVENAMQKLKDNGHKIVIVTWQFSNINKKLTLDWLDALSIPYDDICFTKDKWMIQGDIIIDDNPEFILNEKETAYKYLVDQPYNQECNFEGSRVKSLSEAVDLICR